jgi:hypothetical protein
MNFRLTRPLPLPITRRSGPLAQLVEQLTFNQWVAGSNPARLTTVPKNVNENSTDIVLAIFAFSNVFQTRSGRDIFENRADGRMSGALSGFLFASWLLNVGRYRRSTPRCAFGIKARVLPLAQLNLPTGTKDLER